MKKRALMILLILGMGLTAWFWIITIVPYFIVTGKTLPLFKKVMDYIFTLE